MALVRKAPARWLLVLIALTVLTISQWSRVAAASTGNPPSQKELEQLVSPIALYPDTLVAQILAASTHPV